MRDKIHLIRKALPSSWKRTVHAACFDVQQDVKKGGRHETFLPRFAIVKTAGTHDSAEAVALCADVKAGEIIVFDKAYIDFAHLHNLGERGIFWVTRAKDNMAFEIVGQHMCGDRRKMQNGGHEVID